MPEQREREREGEEEGLHLSFSGPKFPPRLRTVKKMTPDR